MTPSSSSIRSIAIGCGSYLPKNIVTNDDLAKKMDTSDEWIKSRTGIFQRHIAADGEHTSDLASKAAQNALTQAGIDASSIDLIILATTTPDNTFPSSATRVQHLLNIKSSAAFDIQAVCSGFIYALATADSFIRTGQAKRVLVIGAETLSRILDWNDRRTCVLFGDGAGAVILEGQEVEDSTNNRGILSTHLYSDGSARDILFVDGGPGSINHKTGCIRMEGQEVFKHAIQKLTSCTKSALEANHLTVEDIDWVIPHQANQRILDGVIKKLRAPKSKLISTVNHHANTSAASIPLAIADAVADKKIQRGDLLALQAIGGGLTWGSALIRW